MPTPAIRRVKRSNFPDRYRRGAVEREPASAMIPLPPFVSSVVEKQATSVAQGFSTPLETNGEVDDAVTLKLNP